MNERHKHADLIIAWANGAEIEFRQSVSQAWVLVRDPVWAERTEYRIKPEAKKPVVRWQWIVRWGSCALPIIPNVFYTEDEIEAEYKNENATIIGKAEWTRMEFEL